MSYRKIFFRDGGTVTIEDGIVTDGTLPPESTESGPYVMPDLSGAAGEFISPIDGTLISSRSQLRAHNRRHGVDQIGNDYKFEQRKADMMARYGRDPDGQFKEKYREHMGSVNASWTDPGRP